MVIIIDTVTMLITAMDIMIDMDTMLTVMDIIDTDTMRITAMDIIIIDMDTMRITMVMGIIIDMDTMCIKAMDIIIATDTMLTTDMDIIDTDTMLTTDMDIIIDTGTMRITVTDMVIMRITVMDIITDMVIMRITVMDIIIATGTMLITVMDIIIATGTMLITVTDVIMDTVIMLTMVMGIIIATDIMDLMVMDMDITPMVFDNKCEFVKESKLISRAVLMVTPGAFTPLVMPRLLASVVLVVTAMVGISPELHKLLLVAASAPSLPTTVSSVTRVLVSASILLLATSVFLVTAANITSVTAIIIVTVIMAIIIVTVTMATVTMLTTTKVSCTLEHARAKLLIWNDAHMVTLGTFTLLAMLLHLESVGLIVIAVVAIMRLARNQSLTAIQVLSELIMVFGVIHALVCASTLTSATSVFPATASVFVFKSVQKHTVASSVTLVSTVTVVARRFLVSLQLQLVKHRSSPNVLRFLASTISLLTLLCMNAAGSLRLLPCTASTSTEATGTPRATS
jgi:hypothetical protein